MNPVPLRRKKYALQQWQSAWPLKVRLHKLYLVCEGRPRARRRRGFNRWISSSQRSDEIGNPGIDKRPSGW
jgi:hypothetical protein